MTEPQTEIAQTEIAAFNDGPSEDALAWEYADDSEWRYPTRGLAARINPWLKHLRGLAVYGIPAALIVAALTFVFGGSAAPGAPVVAPPTAAVPTPSDQGTQAQDDAFINQLVQGGIVISDRQSSIGAGHWVCSYFAEGGTRQKAVEELVAVAAPDAARHHQDFDAPAANTYIDAATKIYCPRFSEPV